MNSDNHIGTDPERLEQFILGRLSGEEARQAEEHIRTCPECRSAVRAEREMAAGVRRFARQEMKARLARRLGTTARVSVPWQHITAVAAAILIVVGIGWYSNWFGMPGREPVTILGEIREQKPPAGSERQDSPPGPETHARDSESNIAADESSEALSGNELRAGREAPAEESKKESREVRKRPSEIAAGGKDRGNADLDAPAPSVATANSMGAPPVRQQLWTTGVVFEESARAPGEQPGKERSDKATFEADHLQLRTEGTAVRQKGAISEATPVVRIDQRPLSSLPPAQQMLQLQSERHQVQTLIDHSPDTLRIVLYLEHLLDAQSLRAATAEQIGEDSLVIRVQGQTIGLKIPSPYLQSRQTK